jgi:hypothetical protein
MNGNQVGNGRNAGRCYGQAVPQRLVSISDLLNLLRCLRPFPMWAMCSYQSHNHTLPADFVNQPKQKGGGSLLNINVSQNPVSNKVIKEGALKSERCSR